MNLELERRSDLVELALGRCHSLTKALELALQEQLSPVQPKEQQRQQQQLPERVSVAIEIAAYDPEDGEEEQALAAAHAAESAAQGGDWKRRKVVVLRLTSGGGAVSPGQEVPRREGSQGTRDEDAPLETGRGVWSEAEAPMRLALPAPPDVSSSNFGPPPLESPLEFRMETAFDLLEAKSEEVKLKLKELSAYGVGRDAEMASLTASGK